MSALEVIVREAQRASGECMEVASAASALQEFALSSEHRIELEVQLLDRLREIADSISHSPFVVGGGAGSRGSRVSESGKSGIEVRVDVHGSPSVGVPDVAPSGSDETSVGAASGVVPSATPEASPTGAGWCVVCATARACRDRFAGGAS